MTPRGATGAVVALALALVLLAACGGTDGARDADRGAVTTTTASMAPTTVPDPPPTTPVSAPATAPPTTTPPAFSAVVAPVTATELGASWREGCPVGPADLRGVTLAHWDFAGQVRTGTLVVHADAVDAVTTVFERLFAGGFPIRLIEPVARYGGDDDASMAVDNTSAFNCRPAVAPGAPQWSAHAYGRAIDVNPVENPYVLGREVLPPAGAGYTDRTLVRPGMAVPDGPLVEAFAAVGWEWGGRWGASPDYQHFSAGGR